MIRKCKISKGSFVNGQFDKDTPDFHKALSAKGTIWARGSFSWSKKDKDGNFIWGQIGFVCFDEYSVHILEKNIGSALVVEGDLDFYSSVDKTTGKKKSTNQIIVTNVKLADGDTGKVIDKHSTAKANAYQTQPLDEEEEEDDSNCPF